MKGRATAVASVALALVVGFLVLSSLKERHYALSDDQSAKRERAGDGRPAERPIPWNALPTVMDVPATEMYSAFEAQHRGKIDSRLLIALSSVTRKWEILSGTPEGTFGIGQLSQGKWELQASLVKGKKRLAVVTIPLPNSFPDLRGAIETWINALESATGSLEQLEQRGKGEHGRLSAAEQFFDLVDPRFTLAGLSSLEKAFQEGTWDAESLLLAARGYTMLSLVLNSPYQSTVDLLDGEALAFLSLADKLLQGNRGRLEEALLAMVMGYRGHANRLLQELKTSDGDVRSAILKYYLARDLSGLEQIAKKGEDTKTSALAGYLLARLYRTLGLTVEAAKAASDLLSGYEIYPAIVENINSGGLNLAKALTLFYPLDIITRLESSVLPWDVESEERLEERIKAFAGSGDSALVRFDQFEEMLAKWDPFAGDGTYSLFVDTKRAKSVYRILYIDALWMRFDLLHRRWAVLDAAYEFSRTVAGEAADVPLLLYMQALAAAEVGDRKSADQLFLSALDHRESSGALVLEVYRKMGSRYAFRKFPVVEAKLDGRPWHLYYLGSIYGGQLWNLDRAAWWYREALALDPLNFYATWGLASVLGSSEPMQEAVAKYESNYELTVIAARFFAGSANKLRWREAERLFQEALRVTPSRRGLYTGLAGVLRKLQRYQEAVATYDHWIEKYGSQNLETLDVMEQRSATYRAMKMPEKALESMGDSLDSYKADTMIEFAKCYEDLGRLEDAADVYRRVLERYPGTKGGSIAAAGFYWRQGDFKTAAELLALARSRLSIEDRDWYGREFVRNFKERPKKEAVQAIRAMRREGATTMELRTLAQRLHANGRVDVAASTLVGVAAQHPMETITNAVVTAYYMREYKGNQMARQLYEAAVVPSMKGMSMMAFLVIGDYEGLLLECGDPDAYEPKHREFVWLAALVAEKAGGGEHPQWSPKLRKHYKGETSTDAYYMVGRFIEGHITVGELLSSIKNAKQRCEFAYYIGLASRIRGEFEEATKWYQICMQTLLENNGEYHWAGEELHNWRTLGIEKRHRLRSDDLKEIRAEG